MKSIDEIFGGWGFFIFAFGLSLFIAGEVAGKRIYNFDWSVCIGFVLLLWGLNLLINDKIKTVKEEIMAKIEEKIEEKLEDIN